MTYEEWKAKHREEIEEMVRVTTNATLHHLYNAFVDEVYQDGYNDGVETTEEMFLREREEEL